MKENNQDFLTIEMSREKEIIKVSAIGIVTNVFLAIFKALVGLASRSIAITLDAVNNLSDALSSVITIIGAKLGARKPDKKHPFGHGRIEYLSSMIVSAIVIYAGITAFIESVKKILHPEVPAYGPISLIVMTVAIIVKLILGKYVKEKGKKFNSAALMASGSDALMDAILSVSVLISAIIYLIWGISLEAYVGLVISIFIIKAGVEMMKETLDDIIGHREDTRLSERIKEIFNKEAEVRGTFDILLFNYGPDKYYGSAHIELPDTMSVNEVDHLTRRLQLEVYKETGVIMTGIGIYSYNTTDEEVARIHNRIQETVMYHEWALQMHGFYVDLEKKKISFDVVVSFDSDFVEAYHVLYQEIQSLYPEYELQIITDMDVID